MESRLEKSKAILLRLDADTLEQRSKRRSAVPALSFPVTSTIPDRTFKLLSEAASCFVNGEYNGCVSVLATAVEYSLRKLLHSRSRLETLIDIAEKQGVLNAGQVAVLDELRRHRNNVIHSNLPELARGVVLRVQDVILTEKGLAPVSDWSEVEPQDEAMQEVADSLTAESIVQHMLLNTQRVLCELHGGTVESDLDTGKV